MRAQWALVRLGTADGRVVRVRAMSLETTEDEEWVRGVRTSSVTEWHCTMNALCSLHCATLIAGRVRRSGSGRVSDEEG